MAKKIKEYEVCDYLKLGDSKFQVIQVRKDSSLKVLSLVNHSIMNIKNEGLRKFKPSEKDIKAFDSLLNRLTFEEPEDLESFIPLVTFPTPENLEALKKAKKIGFDIETYGTVCQDDAFYPEKGEIRLLQVYVPEIEKTIIWDTGTLKKSRDLMSLPGIDILQAKLFSKKCVKYIHNAAFESKWVLDKFGIPINNVVDSMILSQLYWAGLQRGFAAKAILRPNSLEQVVLRVLGVKPDKKNQSYDYALPLGASQYNYAALDSYYTFQVGEKLLEMCNQEGLEKVVNAELSSIPAFAMMNYYGIPTCKKTLENLLEVYKEAANNVILPWLEKFPGTNPGSPKQVAECLKKGWNIEPFSVDSKTKVKKAATDNATLTPYALKEPIIDGLLFWRSLKKDVEYIEQYLNSIIQVNGIDVIRQNYNQNAPTCTGRSSSSSPNMQNIPTPTPKRKALGLPPIRTAFKAPEGYKMIIVDLAASHAQIARYASQDKKLIEANESGIKLHFYTVQGILEMEGVKADIKEVEAAKKNKDSKLHKRVSELYDPAKTVFYGGLNLNGAATLQASFLKKADMLLSLETCKQYVEGGRKAYSGLYQFQMKQIREANSVKNARQFSFENEEGELIKIGAVRGFYGTARSLDGGRLFIEKMPNKFNKGAWEVSGTDAVSYAWLRPEATIIKKSLGKICNHIYDKGFDAWIHQMTHDEIGAIVREDQAVDLAAYMTQTITQTFQEFVPDYLTESAIPYDYICDNWSEK